MAVRRTLKLRVTPSAKVFRLIPPGFPGKTRLARSLLRFDDNPVEISVFSDLRLYAPAATEPVAFHLLIDGVYEPDLLRFLLHEIEPNSVFVDVGANIGALSCPLARMRSDITVVAVEASPQIVPFLQQNIVANDLAKVRMIALAAHSDPAELEFYVPPAAHFGMGSRAPQFHVEPVRVPADRLDNLLTRDERTRVSVIKIDVEGAELDVLEGARSTLAARKPVVVLEFVDWAEERLHERGAAQRLLLEIGYELYELKRRKTKALVRPVMEGAATIIARPGPKTILRF